MSLIGLGGHCKPSEHISTKWWWPKPICRLEKEMVDEEDQEVENYRKETKIYSNRGSLRGRLQSVC